MSIASPRGTQLSHVQKDVSSAGVQQGEALQLAVRSRRRYPSKDIRGLPNEMSQ